MTILKKTLAALTLFELTAVSLFCINLISIEPSWRLFLLCNAITVFASLAFIVAAVVTTWAINELFK